MSQAPQTIIAFIQAFGYWGRGGGSRILRGLLDCEHPPAISIVTIPAQEDRPTPIDEFTMPVRPRLGRLEHTRLATGLTRLDPFFRVAFEKKLARFLVNKNVTIVHLIGHGYDIVPVTNVATLLGLPLFLSVHDDIEYLSHKNLARKEILSGLARAWQYATGVYAISEEMGVEYCRRYGKREFTLVTDGLKSYAAEPLTRPQKSLRVYFMGLIHMSYLPNFRALLDALKLLRTKLPDWQIELTMRAGSFLEKLSEDDVKVTVLPFASEREVERDMGTADLLYMPLPFAKYAEAFGKFSLSTKMVTYLGSGLPILYHGPAETAARSLLSRSGAAIAITTDEPAEMARQILASLPRRNEIVAAALKLARERFDLAEQQRRFWNPISEALNPRNAK